MTDHPPTDDELVSAVLDGEATPEEVARVDRDPALRARRDALAAAAAAVGTPVAPLEGAAVDEVVGRAVAAAPRAGAPGEAPGERDRAAVVPLAAARARRTWVIAAAAAIAVLALVGIPFALSDDSAQDQFTAVGSAVSGDDATATAEGAPTTTAPLAAQERNAADGATTFESGQGEDALPPEVALAPDAPTGATVGLAPAGTIASDDDLLAWAEDVGIPATGPDRASIDATVAVLAAPTAGPPPPCVAAARPGAVAAWSRATGPAGPAVIQVVPVVTVDGLRTVLVLADATSCAATLTAPMPMP